MHGGLAADKVKRADDELASTVAPTVTAHWKANQHSTDPGTPPPLPRTLMNIGGIISSFAANIRDIAASFERNAASFGEGVGWKGSRCRVERLKAQGEKTQGVGSRPTTPCRVTRYARPTWSEGVASARRAASPDTFRR